MFRVNCTLSELCSSEIGAPRSCSRVPCIYFKKRASLRERSLSKRNSMIAFKKERNRAYKRTMKKGPQFSGKKSVNAIKECTCELKYIVYSLHNYIVYSHTPLKFVKTGNTDTTSTNNKWNYTFTEI